MSGNFLDNIIAHKKKINESKQAYFKSIKQQLQKNEYQRYALFKNQISKPGKLNLIAEIKKASPSKGVIRDDFDIINIASIYENSGAKAFSVLTEDKFFLGKPEYIRMVSEKQSLPILAKDFFIEEGQIFEARINGASAILLIAAILTDEQIKEFIETASSLDMDCLLEVHNEEELERALVCGADIIGVNNRDLNTFEVDLKVTEKLFDMIPDSKVVVSESGIKTKKDIDMLRTLGINAVLIGETFMRAENISDKIKELMG